MNNAKSKTNLKRRLKYSTPFVKGYYVEEALNLEIRKSSIVTNMSAERCTILGPQESELLPGASSIYKNAVIANGAHLCIHEVRSTRNLGSVILRKDWTSVAKAFPQFNLPEETPLWRSNQVTVARLDLDITTFTQQQIHVPRQGFDLKVNLWYAPPQTDCLIHNKHTFYEFHTQIVGTGRMQKFLTRSFKDLYEDVMMSPGMSHASFAKTVSGADFTYPWHQYYSDTECVWMAVEYHPVTG